MSLFVNPGGTGGMISFPFGTGAGQMTINPGNELLNILPWFISTKQIMQNPMYLNTPLQWTNMKTEVVGERVEDQYFEYGKNDWFNEYFPTVKSQDYWKKKMTTKYKFQRYIAQPTKEGPDSFTGLTFKAWMTETTTIGTGTELKYGFQDTVAGRKLYLDYIAVMAGSIVLSIKVHAYERINATTDGFFDFTIDTKYNIPTDEMESDLPKIMDENFKYAEALEECVKELVEDFNCIHTLKWAAFQKLNTRINYRETNSIRKLTTAWIIDERTNDYLIMHPSNSQNKYVGQYNVPGDGPLNRLNGMRDISMIAGIPTAIQGIIPVTNTFTYNPMRSPFRLGESWILPWGLHGDPANHSTRGRWLSIHDGHGDKPCNLTYSDLVHRGYPLLKPADVSKVFPSIIAENVFFNGIGEAVTARTFYVMAFYHGKMMEMMRAKKVDGKQIWQDTLNTKLGFLDLGKVLKAGAGAIKPVTGTTHSLLVRENDIHENDYWTGAPVGLASIKSIPYIIGKREWKNQAPNHYTFLSHVFETLKDCVKKDLLPEDLYFKTETDTALTSTIKLATRADLGLLVDIIMNYKKGYVGVDPAHNLVNDTFAVGTSALVNESTLLPTLIQWESGYSGLRGWVRKIVLDLNYPNPGMAKLKSVIRSIEAFSVQNLVEYELYARVIYGLLDASDAKNVDKLIKLEIDPGYGVQIFVPNECYIGSNALRTIPGQAMEIHHMTNTEVDTSTNDKTKVYEFGMRKEFAVNVVDPELFSWARAIAVTEGLYGNQIEFPLNPESLDPGSCWTRDKFLPAMKKQKSTVTEYKAEPSVLVFFIPPWYKYKGIGLQVLTQDERYKKLHIEDPHGLYKDLLLGNFSIREYIGTVSTPISEEILQMQINRNWVVLPGPYMAYNTPNPSTNSTPVDYPGKWFRTASSAKRGFTLNEERYGKAIHV